MNGKIIGIILVTLAAVAGGAMYWLQVHAFYDRLPPGSVAIRLTSVATGRPEPIPVADVQAIDSDSSPLRFRACFTISQPRALLTETYEIAETAVPLVAPGWFDCFDASEIGAALADGRAIGYVGERDILDGIDRITAIFEDGRGYAWHQLNEKLQD